MSSSKTIIFKRRPLFTYPLYDKLTMNIALVAQFHSINRCPIWQNFLYLVGVCWEHLLNFMFCHSIYWNRCDFQNWTTLSEARAFEVTISFSRQVLPPLPTMSSLIFPKNQWPWVICVDLSLILCPQDIVWYYFYYCSKTNAILAHFIHVMFLTNWLLLLCYITMILKKLQRLISKLHAAHIKIARCMNCAKIHIFSDSYLLL